jgi:hypothetical protein
MASFNMRSIVWVDDGIGQLQMQGMLASTTFIDTCIAGAESEMKALG